MIDGDSLVFFNRPYSESVFPLNGIGSIVCFGDISFDLDVIPSLLEANIRIIYFGVSGDCLGSSEPSFRYVERLDLLQFQMEDAQKIAIAKSIIWGTLRQHRRFLQRSARERIEGLGEFIQKIEWAIAAIAQKRSLASVAGCLGSGRSAYYQALPKCIRTGGWEWSGRTEPTPFNAMLEFTYRLLEQSCITAIAIAGLNPHCGIWRKNGDFALAKDLSTEFRFLADAVVMRVVNQRQIYSSDFAGWEPNLNKLSVAIRRLLLKEYRKKMAESYTLKRLDSKISFESLIQFQCFQFQQCVCERGEFCPVAVK